MDLDGANGGGGREGSWWFASHGPRTLSIFLEVTLRERLSAAGERDATDGNFVLQPESTRRGSTAGFGTFAVPAWAGIGLMNQQLRLNGALDQPSSDPGLNPASALNPEGEHLISRA